jgi:hypothetical protein
MVWPSAVRYPAAREPARVPTAHCPQPLLTAHRITPPPPGCPPPAKGSARRRVPHTSSFSQHYNRLRVPRDARHGGGDARPGGGAWAAGRDPLCLLRELEHRRMPVPLLRSWPAMFKLERRQPPCSVRDPPSSTKRTKTAWPLLCGAHCRLSPSGRDGHGEGRWL